jgi:hypothetical protein
MTPSYQFQKLKVSMRDLCTTGFAWDPDLVRGFHTHNYVFDAAKVVDDASKSGLSIDQSLTFELAKGLQRNPIESPLLAWLSIKPSQIHIGICGKKSRVQAPWLANSPGFDEYGRDIIRTGAIPFVYWSGLYCFRVHDVLEFPEDCEYACQDFGSLVGTLTSECSKDDFDRIRDDPNRNVEYSAIPHEHEIVLQKRGDRLTITQAFLELLDNMPEEHS